MVLHTQFEKFITESSDSSGKSTLYEIIVKDSDGETDNHLMWATDAGDAIEKFRKDHSGKKAESIHAEELTHNEIERIKDKVNKKIEDFKVKMSRLASEYAELKKDKKKEEDMLSLLAGDTKKDEVAEPGSLAE